VVLSMGAGQDISAASTTTRLSLGLIAAFESAAVVGELRLVIAELGVADHIESIR